MNTLEYLEQLGLDEQAQDALFALCLWVDQLWLESMFGYANDDPNVPPFAQRLHDETYVALLRKHSNDHDVSSPILETLLETVA